VSFSTMMDRPLLISDLFEHGRKMYPDSRVITVGEGGDRIGTYAEVADRTEQFAKALIELGVQREDRVGTFCWNSQEHLEAYFAISSMGAVMHTLNIRLFPEQLAFVINHAKDRVIIVDDTLVPVLAKVAKDIKTSKRWSTSSWSAMATTRPFGRRRERRFIDTTSFCRPNPPVSTGLSSMSAHPLRWRTPAARPATPRASCIATARRCCTRTLSRPARSPA